MSSQGDWMQTALALGAGLAAFGSIGYGYLQKRKYERERQEKVSSLMENAHEVAKLKNANKSIDELVVDSNKRYGPAVADEPEDK